MRHNYSPRRHRQHQRHLHRRLLRQRFRQQLLHFNARLLLTKSRSSEEDMAAPNTVTVTRFPKGADQNVKREFAKTLVKALDEMMVPPGVPFVVTTPEYMEGIEREAEDARRDLHEGILQREDAEAVATSVREMVADYERGILDRAELFDRVRELEHGA
jgi:hypothetical protein